jgi:dCMP deaminase
MLGELKGDGKRIHYTDCNSEQPCKIAMHAEANAIAFAARHGVGVEGAHMHITFSPCLPCSMLIINAGIVRVRWEQSYRISDGIELMKNAGIDAEMMF